MQQAGYFHSLWLRIRAVGLTLAGCCQVLWLHFKNKSADPRDYDLIVQNWADKLIDLVGAEVVVNDPLNLQLEAGKPYILMCNHASLYDIPLSYFVFRDKSIRMLAKKELSYIPVLRQAMDAANFPFIDRKNRRQAIRDLNAAKKLMQEGMILWIAPEGTRSQNGKLQKFKKGTFITAIQTRATLIPLAIGGAFELYDNRTKKIQLNRKITLTLGEPIDSTEYAMHDKDSLLADAHKAMSSLLP